MNTQLTPYDVAVCAAQEAGKVLARYFHEGFEVRNKGVADLVTDADVAAERRIAEIIRSAFPDHAILGEEENSGDVTAEHLWVIDPLDGTTNFAHHIPHFAVSIAYLHHGVAQCGVVWNPIREDLYIARRGHGSSHNGKAIHVGGQTANERISDRDRVLLRSWSHDGGDIGGDWSLLPATDPRCSSIRHRVFGSRTRRHGTVRSLFRISIVALGLRGRAAPGRRSWRSRDDVHRSSYAVEENEHSCVKRTAA
jgi:hypothetical protein